MGKKGSNRFRFEKKKNAQNVQSDSCNMEASATLDAKDESPVLNQAVKKKNIIVSDNGNFSAPQKDLLGKNIEDNAFKQCESFNTDDISNQYASHEDILHNSLALPGACPEYEKCLDGYARENGSGSDEEYSTSDFFQPVFSSWAEEISSNEMNRAKNFYGTDKNSDCKTNLSPKACYSANRSCIDKQNFDGKKLKENISTSVSAYRNSKHSFSDIYHTWLPQRRNTLQKLKTLHSEIHEDQLNFNRSQAFLKEISFASHGAKLSTERNGSFGFLASFAAFLGDAGSCVASVAQAFNVDSYQIKFQEIMEPDAEITKRLYKARSQCVESYQDIEEVMRNFHSDTFSSTVGKISNALEVDKYWESMKNAYGNDDMPKLLNVVQQFFDNACQSEKLGEVGDSIQSYVHNNPAALEACKSAGRTTCGAFDAFGGNSNRNKALGALDIGANMLMMREDQKEIERLTNTISENGHQCKLESQIEEAIDSLGSEMVEISNIYFELFRNYIDDDDIFP